jgi:colanic acid/amylovoran biosynthesis glycosyltransferase
VTSFYGADIWKLGRQESWRRRYEELFAAGARFLVEGHAMRARVIELGCPPEKVVVQHLGVDLADTALVPRAPGPDGEVRLRAAGRAVEKKGFELAVEAFGRARAEHDGLHLSLMLIARSRPEEERVRALRERVRELDLSAVVDFPAPMPYAAYRRALEGYHVFLAPSRHAADGDAEGGAPVSLIEMSASGMPIVASDHCDIPEVVPDGRSGRIVPEGDVEALAAAILELARDPARWPAWGRAGRAHVEAEYRLDAQVAKLEAIYDGLTA